MHFFIRLFSRLPRAVFRVRARRRLHEPVVRGKFFLVAAALAISVFLIHSFTRSPITPQAQAVEGTLTISGTSQTLTGDVTAGRLVDQANSSYYIDPAASGNSLITAGAASVSGNLILNAGATIGTTNMQPLTLGSATTGLTTVTSAGKLQLQAGGAGTGSTGTGSIYFLDNSGTSRGRFDTITFSAIGGTIATASGFTRHTFTSGTATFTPNTSGNVEVLVVAGGGGGGGGAQAPGPGGGGGGGGVIYDSSYSVTAQSYTVTVGSGGAGGVGGSQGSDGGNSVFATSTATGGGGGGSSSAGRSGGSGGGGGYANSNGGSGLSGQGNAGGNGLSVNPPYLAGGGGGGGGVGANATSTAGGNGGAGVTYSISGSSVTYGGGGGGGTHLSGTPGTGGSGGGGNAGTPENTNANGGAGGPNTGGGGGGATLSGTGSANGGAGGSGIVIIRYSSTYGALYLGMTNTSSADLAEYYVAGDRTIEAGDVVTIANSKYQIANSKGKTEELVSKGVLRKAEKPYDRNLIGVISTSPGVLMGSVDGEDKADKRALALSGKTPVKIDPDSPAILVGDFLTSSARAGLAMKATRPGYVVARALEAWSPGGADRIEAFIQLTYYMGDIDERGDFRSLEVDTLKAKTVQTEQLEVGGVNILDRIRKLEEEIDTLKRL